MSNHDPNDPKNYATKRTLPSDYATELSPTPASEIAPNAETEIAHGATSGAVLVGRYRIEKELARGGIGVVYLARDQRLDNMPVVVKVLLESNRNDEFKAWFEKKFRDEITALARINHPNVIRALDVGELPDGKIFLVMQYVAGVNLRTIMRPQGVELTRVARVMSQLGQALTAAHEQGVFHRDLKPENVMLETVHGEEFVRLIDFGIASVLEEPNSTSEVKTTAVAGTVDYMAPEQLRGKPVAATDTYALGVIAYELVTGRRPFNPDSSFQLLELQKAGVKIKPCDLRPSLSAEAQAVILKALSYSPTDRYARARDFGDALARALTTEAKEQVAEPGKGLELAHVLFTDLVGYSKLTIDDQTRRLRTLQEIVSGTEEFRQANSRGQLISLPTGDGMALVFFGDPIAPVRCAVEIARALKAHSELHLRIGIHTGPVQRMADINQNMNVSGGGINIAQRVMDCGDAGNILLSRNVADVLSQTKEWSGYLKDWGEQEVKHGVRVHIFNLCTEEVGNPYIPKRLKSAPISTKRPSGWALALAALLVIVIVGSGVAYYLFRPAIAVPYAPTAGVVERTINYSLTVKVNQKSQPFSRANEMLFQQGNLVQVNINSPQSGFLYIVNRGPKSINGQVDLNVLFPDTITNNGSAEIPANRTIQIPQPSNHPERDWFILDGESGTEKIWLIWSGKPVPELEAVKRWANPHDKGAIGEKTDIQRVLEFLSAHPDKETIKEKDKDGKQTQLKSKSDPLVGLIELEHQN